MTYMGNSIVCHKRLVSTYRSKIDKYRRHGNRIFDEIEVDLGMLNTRATFVNPLGAALQDVRAGLTLYGRSDGVA